MPKFLGQITQQGGDFALLDSSDLRGGFMQVKTLQERDSIVEDKLKIGMVVFVEETDKFYKYEEPFVWTPQEFTSGKNLKTINGLSLVGPGNIDLDSISGSSSADPAFNASTLNVIQNSDTVRLEGYTIGGTRLELSVTPASSTQAGITSAEDKRYIEAVKELLVSLIDILKEDDPKKIAAFLASASSKEYLTEKAFEDLIKNNAIRDGMEYNIFEEDDEE